MRVSGLFVAVVLGVVAHAGADEVFVLQNARTVQPYAGPYTGEHAYMNCDDTYVSAATPDGNFGGSPELVLEPGRTKVLIRFG